MDSPRPLLELLVDTGSLWPGVVKTADLESHASRALAQLTRPERAAALRFVFARDAKLAIASALLKRLAASALLRIPWAAAGPAARDRAVRGGKPVFASRADPAWALEFNVSHQDGVVALAAYAYATGATTTTAAATTTTAPAPAVEIGVDVVSPRERRVHDMELIGRDGSGWPRFVDMHADLLAAREVVRLKALAPGGAEGAVEAWCRALYALWCLREAFVKMSGAALVAPWLRSLEFGAFRPPAASGGGGGGGEGEQLTEAELDVTLAGAAVDGVRVRLGALPGGMMVCVAASGLPDGVALGRWRWIGMERVLEFAEHGGGDWESLHLGHLDLA